ncbi:hypothetical protein E4U42_006832 [Claviceps africana]|uniref:chitinase n=1 Tax=Claviceps africana TaxID=83212 RepID=A0A8K0J2R7_9HYPO|nr:hypothetical protein E4U42_006832 [Claviceps africana]
MLCKSILAAAAILGLVTAQVQTNCNPMERDCPPNPAFGTSHLFQFNSTPDNDLWETTAGIVHYDAKNGASFTIAKQGDSPTLRTRFYFFFGRTEVWLKVASGRGIISSMMWLSDDLDEVDWEFLGSNKSFATTNYFGKGRQDYKNGGSHPMSGMQDDFHNYTTLWTRESIQWFIDGSHVRTLNADDANKTRNYPQTPMRLSIGIWAGGDPSLPEGTREWAGGDTDYASGPYTMLVRSAQITDFSTGKEYAYGDRSGSWESIKMVAGNSSAMNALSKQPGRSIADRWAALSSTAKTAVYGAGAGVAGLAFCALLWYYLRQRRIGAVEAKAAQERELIERRENEDFQKRGIDPDAFIAYGQEYNARQFRSEGMSDANSYHVSDSNPFNGPFDEKSRLGSSASNASGMVGGAAVAGEAVGAAGTMRGYPGRTASPQASQAVQADSDHHGFDFGVPPSPGSASHLPLMHPQSPGAPLGGPPRPPQMGSGSTHSGYARVGSPASQESFGMQRMQSPGTMSQQRNFADHERVGVGYRGQAGSGSQNNNGWY